MTGPSETVPARPPDRAASDAEDRRLVLLCKDGDRGAFNDLILRYEKKVYNFAYRLCGNYDDASDIASEAFIRVFNALPGFRGDSSFITWIFRITTNVYLDAKKKQKNRPVQSLNEIVDLEESSVTVQIEDPSPTPQVAMELSEKTRLLQKAIESLPDYQRAMIVMYHTEGQSYEEIAEALELPIGTVKSRLNRARLSLRQILLPEREHFP